MTKWVLTMALVCCATPSFAQLGGLMKAGQKALDAKEKYDALKISEADERALGETVSAKIRERFGVVQDEAVHKYVSLVGTLLAKQSERPNLNWTFIVLDTDGVNAFASPGGLVHITRGALGLIQNEAQLAGVLGHEITHVSHKHALGAIQKGKVVEMGTEKVGNAVPFADRLAQAAYDIILENKFDRGDEVDADRTSVVLLQKSGYAPASLADFLARLDERNKDQPEQNGLFASHPAMKERIDKIRSSAGAGARVEARYKQHIKYQPVDVTTIATVQEGSSGLTGSTKKEEEPKKKGGGMLSSLKPASSKDDSKSASVQASGGARGLGPDRLAKGGSNPNPVKVAVSAAELDAFKKGIA